MHTLTAIVVGVSLMWLFQKAGQRLRLRRNLVDATFAALWLIASVVHGLLGVAAGFGVGMELAIGALIFLVPVSGLALGRWQAKRTRPTLG
ncbi:hypothetical protein [Pseudomonas sp. Marseille-Q5115]|uniref:hypothetical protein n=1 Tax=Pseudomonas sp. Marseille-Q5115 TaxID=2866593 RepID=UPI001CE47BF3|nr:hypothetical protein [Pseudomonas sp. Marseille-Q5115]